MRLSSYLLPILLCFFYFPLLAQSSQRTTEAITITRDQIETRHSAALPYYQQLPFFSYFIEWPNGTIKADIRFSKDGEDWTTWNTFVRDEHNLDKGISTLQFGEPDYRYYELRIDNRRSQVQSAILHFYQPGVTVPTGSFATPGNPADPNACPCPQPDILVRNQWCPNGDCPEHPNPSSTEVTHLIVHHSAGTNSANDWAAIVRAVWDLHVNGNGWDDVGYNYLIDPNGVVYEGRGNNVLGAHFCGTNTNTMGTCMLGTFSDITPTEDAINGLERLLAWKSCDIGADPLGESFHAASSRVLKHISGHRDGCATECPGDAFYPLLPDVRQGVQNQILANCSGLSSPISLSATEVSETAYFLSWAHNSPDEEGFILEWSQDQGDTFQERAQLDANTLSFFEDMLELERIYQYRIRAYNGIDTSEYSNIITINTGLVGTSTPTLPAAALVLSPNPATDILQLELNTPQQGILHLQLLDLQQQLILQKQYRKTNSHWHQQLDLQHLPAGTYLVRLQVGGHQGIWKIIKQ